jgi:hypothetical protein
MTLMMNMADNNERSVNGANVMVIPAGLLANAFIWTIVQTRLRGDRPGAFRVDALTAPGSGCTRIATPDPPYRRPSRGTRNQDPINDPEHL